MLADVDDRKLCGRAQHPGDLAQQTSTGGDKELDDRQLDQLREPSERKSLLEGAQQPAEILNLGPQRQLEGREAVCRSNFHGT